MKLHQWIDCYRNGDFDSPLKTTQIRAGWYDWFCPDRSLAKKTARYSDLIGWIYLNTKIDGEVSFKNCCGSVLYDIIYIGDWLFIDHPKDGWTLQHMDTVLAQNTYAYGLRDIKAFMKGENRMSNHYKGQIVWAETYPWMVLEVTKDSVITTDGSPDPGPQPFGQIWTVEHMIDSLETPRF